MLQSISRKKELVIVVTDKTLRAMKKTLKRLEKKYFKDVKFRP